MIIYKITNISNGKIYIGQTIGTAEQRFHRHIQDAKKHRVDTHLSRAINKYGEEYFTVETIDTAKSQEELTQKEHDYIIQFDAVNSGYNETSAMWKCGGNTYKSKTSQELDAISEKIRNSKIGGNNPNATPVKCKNMETGEEFHFESQAEMQTFFHASNHIFISRRCLGQIKALYQGKWAITYEENDYNPDFIPHKSNNKLKAVIVKDLKTGQEQTFSNYSAAERYFGLKKRSLSSKAYKRGIDFIYKERYQITKVLE